MRDDKTMAFRIREVAESFADMGTPATEDAVMRALEATGRRDWATDFRCDHVLEELIAIVGDTRGVSKSARLIRAMKRRRPGAIVGGAHVAAAVLAFGIADAWGRGWL